MKVLFVCRQNIGRSQMAMALFNKNAKNSNAESAGTIVGEKGKTLEEQGAVNTIQVLKEQGIDAKDFTSLQVTPELITDYDKLIIMSEPENTPDWLRDSPKSEIWTIADTKTSDLPTTREVLFQIKEKVDLLITSN